jgi:hypothetical protein
MSQKPIDQILKKRKMADRPAIWSLIRKTSESFTSLTLSSELKIDRKIITPYLKTLCMAGFIKQDSLENKVGKTIHYNFVEGPSTAPRVRKNGEIIKHGSGQDNMWRSMKILKTFNAHFLAIHSSVGDVSVTIDTAKSYIKMLQRAGYLRALPTVPVSWVLLSSKNTGPHAPMVQRVKQVFDPNLRKVVWPTSGDKNE